MGINRNDLCWCGSGKKYKKCHMAMDDRIDSIHYDVFRGQVPPPHDIIKTPADIEGIRKSGVINDGVLDLMETLIRPGIDTESLNQAAHAYIIDRGATPACLNYGGFPKSVCIAVKDVGCHGIPSKDTILKEGDIVNVDTTTILDGYYADASRMFIVGEASKEAQTLVRVAKECMELGVEAARPWHFLGDVGAAVEAHAKRYGYSIVTALGGHGVGKDFHEEPFVAHVGPPASGMLLVPGMVLTVEPMVNAGKYKVVTDKRDGWTVRTRDGSLSAQWEKTILITETGTEVLSS